SHGDDAADRRHRTARRSGRRTREARALRRRISTRPRRGVNAMTTTPPSPPRHRVEKTPPAGPIAQALARAWLWFFGWKVEGSIPPHGRAIAIAYPHTSNWDMPFMLAIAFKFGIRPSWLGKRQIFRKPFGRLMRWLGGIPVDRSKSTNMVG